MNYPPTCLRGIANFPDCIDSNGRPNERIFRPHSSQFPNEHGWLEFSINWEDDDTVEELTRNQRKTDNTIHFVKGVIRMSREKVDHLKKNQPCMGFLDYERHPLENNPYHGNLLIRNVLKSDGKPDKALRNAIAGQLLTTIIGDIISPPSE